MRRGERNVEGMGGVSTLPLPADLGDLVEHRKLPSWVWGGASVANDFGAFRVRFYAISRIF